MLVRLRRRFLLGLITNGPSNAQWEKIRELGVAQYFDVILVSGDLAWEKPDERIFLEACNALGVRPGECLMVGDKLETDIVGGRQASLGATVWVPLSSAKVDDNRYMPDFTLKNILELPSILSRDNEPPGVMKARSGSFSDRNLLRVSHADWEDANSNASNASDGS